MDRTPLVARVFYLVLEVYLILAQTDQVYLIWHFPKKGCGNAWHRWDP